MNAAHMLGKYVSDCGEQRVEKSDTRNQIDEGITRFLEGRRNNSAEILARDTAGLVQAIRGRMPSGIQLTI
jgi:hypothetical protein